MDLTDEQWAVLKAVIPDPPQPSDGRGHSWRDAREVMNGVLWIMLTGAAWADMPERYLPYPTCHRRFQAWTRDGTFERIPEVLATDLYVRGGLDLSECFIDGTFVIAKKGGSASARPSGAKARKSWQLQSALAFYRRLH